MSFLNKKSWHTGGMPMLKKVWAAEEREKQEQRTIEQLRREKAEERAVEDSRRLQAQQGLITSTPVERLEWMYAGQAMSEAVKQEQYLLGAQVKDTKVADSTAVTAAVQAADERWKRGATEAVAAGKPSSSALEAAARLREDPLMAIMREQHRRTQLAATRPAATATRANAATTPHRNRGRDAERSRERESSAERHGRADRQKDEEGRSGSRSVSGREERTERRERDDRESRRSRERKRARSHRRSHSSDSAHSQSSDDSDRERRRRRRRKGRSRSRSASREARPTQSHYGRSDGGRKGKETEGEARADSAVDGRREGTDGRDQRRHSLPSSASRHEHNGRAERAAVEERGGGAAAAATIHSAPPSAPSSTPSLSLSSAFPGPSVVSTAFVSSTSSFGGRLGLIVPSGAPPPLPANPTRDEQQLEEARTTSAAAAPSEQPPAARSQPPPPRPSLATLSEAERAERLRAMTSDADSLIVSRRQQAAREAEQLSSQRSERAVTANEVERLAAPMLKSLRDTAIAEGRLSKRQPLNTVDDG